MTVPYQYTENDPQTVIPRCAGCTARLWHDGDVRRLEGSPAIFCSWCVWSCDSCHGVYLRADEHSRTVATMDRGTVTLCTVCSEDCVSCYRCSTTFEAGSLFGDYCDECEQEIEEEEERRLEDERERACANLIGPYHSGRRKSATRVVPSPWTRAKGGRGLGLEIEAECPAVDKYNAARAVLEAVHPAGIPRDDSFDRIAWCEQDGSLDDGFEIITQPLGLDAHRELWPRVLDTRAVKGLRSHDTETCGLHVHVSRVGLSKLTIAKAVVFLNADENDRFIVRLARRSSNGYCKKKNDARVNRDACESFDRYERLNLTNRHTVEFRIFRGSLNRKTVLASVEFANAVMDFCAQAAVTDLTVAAFLRWVWAPTQKADTMELRALIARRADTSLRALVAPYITARSVRDNTQGA